MARLLCGVFLLALCAILVPFASAGNRDCQSYRDIANIYHPSQKCYVGFCCGTCELRYCCQEAFRQLTEFEQDSCDIRTHYSSVPMIVGIVSSITGLIIFITCCVCPCCCLYKMCRKPRPVVATTTTTHTTVVTTSPQHYPQQPTAVLGQPQGYQGAQYPTYQPIPVQPGYGTQPGPPSAYPGQAFVPGPPPTYQEATHPSFPAQPMPYSQAAYAPGQPGYPPQPPINPPVSQVDYLTQPAYNPDYYTPPPAAK